MAKTSSGTYGCEVYPWIPDRGDGQYCNPVIFADYSDPDVIRVGEDFYMTASSFNCTPGLPILHSRDLVNWTLIGHAIGNLPFERYNQVQHGGGVWAPAIRFHDGVFYIFFPLVDEGIFMVAAANPAGPWSAPHMVAAGAGLIDPCPLWDDDGKAYLVHAYAYSRSGIKHRLRICPMAADGTKLLDDGKIVHDDAEVNFTTEGPKFHKLNGWYYISAPAGGVKSGWQIILRSRGVYGPYEVKRVLEQGPSPINGPHQGALVDTPDGDWWFVHFQELQPYGRIVHMQPLEWADGWPQIGLDLDGDDVGEPVLTHTKPPVGRQYPIAIPQTSDEFIRPTLGLQWQWHANHRDEWFSLSQRSGFLRLYAQCVEGDDFAKAANLLLQKFPARIFSLETQVELSDGRLSDGCHPQASSLGVFESKDTPKHKTLGGGTASVQAGLIVMGNKHAALALKRNTGENKTSETKVCFIVDNVEVFCEKFDSRTAKFKVDVSAGGACVFSYAGTDGQFKKIDTPFTATEGKWIGAKVGLFCLTPDPANGATYADFDYFRFSGTQG